MLARFGRAYAADADELHRDVRRTVRQEFDGTSPSDPLTLALQQSAIDLSPGDAPEVVESFSDGTTQLRQWTSGIVGVCVVGLIVLMIAWQQPRPCRTARRGTASAESWAS